MEKRREAVYNSRSIFEGEYLYTVRHEYVKEIKSDNLIFEGDYLNGKRLNGKEYEITSDCRLITKYEYLNGKILI